MIRKASGWSGVPFSTLQSAIQRKKKPSPLPVGRPRALVSHEELQVMELLIKLAGEGTPITNEHVADAVSIIVRNMAPLRRLRVPFRGGKPGAKWLRGFPARHNGRITFAKPTHKGAIRFAACTAEFLTAHFAK